VGGIEFMVKGHRGEKGGEEAAEGWETRAGSALEDLREAAASTWEPLSIKVSLLRSGRGQESADLPLQGLASGRPGCV
jgi:hypothetical protein